MALIIILLGVAYGFIVAWDFVAGWIIGAGAGYGISAIVFAVRAQRALDRFNQEFMERFAEGDEALSQLIYDLENPIQYMPDRPSGLHGDSAEHDPQSERGE